ncbi:hypothetical protein A2239_00680 [Candidatus Uhrbacteria bacterium RIFOXYA2_FULL_40_9]|nr:MAG: hypothetical protein UT94_C0006G0009 [Candidatus Uhrbacteria bacterium GW2011_GWF2_40_263]OGL92642.1 MAG: hypothetical protein A2239_00680 [Candidatus Uhrbacteria bacterium RIFOXYA2_FULL_40_9]OGL96712.1 MAG: hypothetical protein A2332_02630 [Candidatus Uhrbacteria bacterium RIFOXYB2_FULL_41_18]HBK34685.1 hypothetical protein [Candidatus Uhrbacteria bacterium]HCB56079.1 hypothetical protein [Candidatus Uhrbacteria bacterium]
MPCCSLVIRTKNEKLGLRALLEMLSLQTVQDVEVIVVDSGSTDGTVSLANNHHCQVITIPSSSFTFGSALNTGVQNAQAPLIITISAHCLPADIYWLERLLQPFDLYPHLAGVYGRQIPFSQASPLEQRGLKEAYPLQNTFSLQDRSFFSNAHAAFRKSVWSQLSFNELLTGAEDIEWAKRVREAGFLLGYEPTSLVFHSHTETRKEVRERFFREALALTSFDHALLQTFGIPGALLRWGKSVFLDELFLLTTFFSLKYFLKWILFIPFYRASVYYGQLQAFRTIDRKI